MCRWLLVMVGKESGRGSPLAAVMIHIRSKQAHVTIPLDSYAKHLPANHGNIFLRQMVLSGISSELHVNQFLTGTRALADSDIMMQLCHHGWKVRNLQLCI